MERYWVYLDNKVQGPVEIPALRKLAGFTLLTQVCPEGQDSWRMADEVIDIKAYFSAPPRGSSLVPEVQPDLPTPVRNQVQIPLPMSGGASENRMPPAGLPRANADIEVLETLEDPPKSVVNGAVARPNETVLTDTLRQPCVTCGYKNPRDVNVCMKCGTPLKAALSKQQEPPAISVISPTEDVLEPALIPAAKKNDTAPTIQSLSSNTRPDSQMVEIPVTRILIILLGVSLAGAIFFISRQIWKEKHRKLVTVQTLPSAYGTSATSSRKGHSVNHANTNLSRRRSKPVAHRDVAEALPGIAPATPARRTTQLSKAPTHEPAISEEPQSPTAPSTYKVLDQAAPLKHRQSSPIDSTYATKRRGDKGLWSGQEDNAIQEAQHYRIYGGQRTIQRNTDILMQILRDREYSTAFESGKRIYLLNDVDWVASQREGPVYEVRLTFSGGREADGSPRTPLRFAYSVDLERQTVEPGGLAAIKSNTMRAFFDESRIPPEDRRSVAKDTEELVKAAQPDASPLALDTIAKHFAATYSNAALSRVSDAYQLTNLNKKLAHETKSVSDVIPESNPTATAQGRAPSMPTPIAPSNKVLPTPSMSGSIQYTLESGEGKERVMTVQAPSHATPNKLWDTLTGYDRLTQFVPDLLVSQREGMDGQAVIVHTVSLTRLMFFVFKINLHLRILEHPQQHRLEFERIAGDFEKFSGYAEITPDGTGTRNYLNLHLSLAPKGYIPKWIVQDMAKKFVLPVIDAVRSRAESY